MGLSNYFSGRSGCLFWLNVLLVIVLLTGIPYAFFHSLHIWTHHGEKITVPLVVSMDGESAMNLLEKKGLRGVISDSIYVVDKPAGVVLRQLPHADNQVKSGRPIYLTLNRSSEPPIRIPDMIRNVTGRLAEKQLTDLGFTLDIPEVVYGEPEGLLIGIKHKDEFVHVDDMLPKNSVLTLVIGGGESPEEEKPSSEQGVVSHGGFTVDL